MVSEYLSIPYNSATLIKFFFFFNYKIKGGIYSCSTKFKTTFILYIILCSHLRQDLYNTTKMVF